MKISVTKDQLVHELAMVAAKGAVDAYIKVELDPSIGISFTGTDLATEALFAYEDAVQCLESSISDD